MTVHRRRTAVFTAYERCRGALLAALTAAALLTGAAPAAAEAPLPTFSVTENRIATPGARHGIMAAWSFDNAGTNPRFTEAVFSTTEYYSQHEISDGIVHLKVKSAAELNALASPPPSPFTVTVDVTMTNDEGQTASGTVTFETTYIRTVPTFLPGTGPDPAAPTLKPQTGPLNAPAGAIIYVEADETFDNAGTNPRITDAVFTTTEYYSKHGLSNGVLTVEVKTSAELSAMASPPSSPINVNLTLTMANDEGQTASGTLSIHTNYTRVTTTPQPSEPEEEEARVLWTANWNTPPGLLVVVSPDYWSFGTNARHTEAVFSTTDYYSEQGVSQGAVWVRAKTAAELNAMASPPPSPFTVTADVTLTNDEGRTGKGKIIFKTTYERVEPEPEPVVPTFSLTGKWHLFPAPGGASISAGSLFNNAGTNARITGVEFSTAKYFRNAYVGHGKLEVVVKSAAELNAMAFPPPSRFTIDAAVTMANDEGQEASGTIPFEVVYTRTPTTPAQPGETEGPTFSVTEPVWAPPGKSVEVSASRIFDNAGRSVRFTDAVFSTTDYYSVHEFDHGQLKVQAKTAAELNALASPPPSTFEVTVEVTMTNNQGQTASGTLTYQTTYKRVEPATTPAPPAGPPPTSGGAGGGTN